ncbi:MAG TPA: inositol monophosphatase family protein, partial [Candidatus Limnocylindrales bacterium]
FIRGVPLFGTLLAVERDGELQAAVISAPALHERWWARRGGGAWARSLDDDAPRRIRVSAVASLHDAQVLYGSGADIERSGLAPGFGSLLGSVWRERGFGDFWGYALLAEGAAEAMVEIELSSWDAAAPTVLIEEAGGRVTDFEGRRAIDSGTFLATNGLLHEQVRARLGG